jgi:hypothetical protein
MQPAPGAIPITALARCIGWAWGLARRALSPQTMQTQRCRKAEAFHERDRKALRLVGDDAPGNFAAGVQFVQVLGHACEQAGADAERVLVDGEEALLQVGVGGIGRRDAESGADHAACARRHVRPKLFHWQRVAPCSAASD